MTSLLMKRPPSPRLLMGKQGVQDLADENDLDLEEALELWQVQ